MNDKEYKALNLDTKQKRIEWAKARRDARIARRKEMDRRVKEGVICGYSLAWHGYCAKPATEARCEHHRGIKCSNCDKQATHECEHAGILVCGFPLCDGCKHPHYRQKRKSA